MVQLPPDRAAESDLLQVNSENKSKVVLCGSQLLTRLSPEDCDISFIRFAEEIFTQH